MGERDPPVFQAGLSLHWIQISRLAWSLYKLASLWWAVYSTSPIEIFVKGKELFHSYLVALLPRLLKGDVKTNHFFLLGMGDRSISFRSLVFTLVVQLYECIF